MFSPGLCGHLALSTLLETWPEEFVFETNFKKCISPNIPKSKNVKFDTKNKSRIIFKYYVSLTWPNIALHVFGLILIDFHWFLLIFIDFHNFSLIFIDFHRFPLILMDLDGFLRCLGQGAWRPVATCGALWRPSPAPYIRRPLRASSVWDAFQIFQSIPVNQSASQSRPAGSTSQLIKPGLLDWRFQASILRTNDY